MLSAPMSSNGMDRCCEACVTCARTCVRTLYRHCLKMGGQHVAEAHVQLMTDCAEVCKVAANFMTRGSPRHVQVCALCADLCQSCAEECARMGGMDDCVSACRQCAEACREMAI